MIAQPLPSRSIERLWERSRRLGLLTQLYRQRVDDWRLLKCARAYAMHRGEVRNAKMVRLLQEILGWLRMRMSEEYRRAHQKLREFSQARKFKLGVSGSAGLRGRLLAFYLSLKNGSAPPTLLIDLYS